MYARRIVKGLGHRASLDLKKFNETSPRSIVADRSFRMDVKLPSLKQASLRAMETSPLCIQSLIVAKRHAQAYKQSAHDGIHLSGSLAQAYLHVRFCESRICLFHV